jgi:hypothetical protein
MSAQAQAVLSVSGLSADKVYDGTTNATVNFSGAILSGVTNGDDVILLTSGYVASFADPNVGIGKTVTVTGLTLGGSAATNYTLAQPSFSASITPRPLGIGATASDKIYDSTVNASVSLYFTNLVAGDNVLGAYYDATFSDKNVGVGKTVTVSGLFIVDPAAANYTLVNTTASTTASISVKLLQVAAFGVNKQYDATTAATVDLYDTAFLGDNVIVTNATAAFSDPYVGVGKTIAVTGIAITGGADAGNYTLNGVTTASAQASITPRTLTVAAAGNNKTYDGTTNATVSLTDNRLTNDNLTISVSFGGAGFSDKNVGSAKTINVVGLQITGSAAGSYALSNTIISATAAITARPLAITATGQDKTYDGAVSATVTLADNRVAGDNFTNTYASAAFSDKNVGNSKTVTVTGIAIGSGADAGNYTLNGVTTAATHASITPYSLTVTAAGQDKTYDGTTNATVTLSDNHLAGDTLTDSYSSAGFTDANVGTGKTVIVLGIQVTGSDAGNYTLSATTATATASINAKALTVAASGVNKVYDGGTNATVSLSGNQLAGDTVVLGFTNASFADKRVGSGKTITVTGINISGGSAGNYTLVDTNATATANITPYSLVVTATGVNKAYDGTLSATVTLQDNRVAGDVFTDSYGSANFTSSSVGNNKTVNVSDITIAGADAGNYSLASTTAATFADITGAAPSFTLASSENPSGFHDAIFFTATLPADATGTVTFSTNGAAFSAGSLSGGSLASATFTNFLRGTNLITATYSGDANYSGTTATLAQVVTNHPPIMGFFSFSVTNGNSMRVSISNLLGAVFDPDGDAVSFVGVGTSTNGVTLITNSTLLFYHNTNLVNDQFSYVVTDGYGGISTGQVAVVSVVAPFLAQSTGRLFVSGATQQVTLYGVPGFVYVVQRSVNMVSWTDIATVTAAQDGTIQATDNFSDLGGPPASAFYRLEWHP